ncbi:MAG TPA: hypothetical protein PKM19_02115, partial [Pseudomonadales bacterium]|nr:hypothetical protein [Pseudomonadales bacterium]HNN64996.1 hypothetical protein [Pseudomonadales bacterium]
ILHDVVGEGVIVVDHQQHGWINLLIQKIFDFSAANRHPLCASLAEGRCGRHCESAIVPAAR